MRIVVPNSPRHLAKVLYSRDLHMQCQNLSINIYFVLWLQVSARPAGAMRCLQGRNFRPGLASSLRF